MPYRQMAPYSMLGTGIWATLFTLLGYFASRNIDAVLSNSEHALLAFAVIVGLIVGGIVVFNYLKVPANRTQGRGVDGGAAGVPQPAGARSPAGSAGAVPARPGDARRARARVHDRARRAGGRQLRR